MIATVVECAAGFVLALVTLRDVFDTVVVPGHTRGALRVSRRLVLGVLPLWKLGRGAGIGVNFAPLMLVASFVVWMALLLLAFAMMAHALADSFSPALQTFSEALYVAGSAMVTIGVGHVEAHGAGSVVAVGAGFCGLAVLTMAVTYLMEVQANVGARDIGVLKISTVAGQPPSAIALLERHAELGCRDELKQVLRDGRDWCAVVLQSHVSHPSLIYFRSAGTASGWPAALGALMDLALMLELLLDEPGTRGPAVLFRAEADRLARDVTHLIGLTPAPAAPTAAEMDALLARLAAAGYRMRADLDAARFIAARAEHVGCIDALSHHLGTAEAPLLGGASRTQSL